LIGIEVSAHLFIKRGGEVIQFVPFNKRAWHAGQSNFKGLKLLFFISKLL
jgi:AmpD protein